MVGKEFLNNFRPNLLSGNVDQMLVANQPQDKSILVEYLRQALENLKTTSGPHLEFRREHADDWIGWWVKFLENKRDKDRGLLIPFEKIKGSLANGERYGVLFAGGFEGHGGHRFAANWMGNFVSPILLLERDWYVESKSRGGPYLDLRARLSMWSHFNPKGLVSVLPEKPVGVDDDTHYKNLFDQTGTDYCFASECDLFSQQKIARGKAAPFLLIPPINLQRTTDEVEKLIPDTDFERLLNTTDHVTRLMPRVEKKEIESFINGEEI